MRLNQWGEAKVRTGPWEEGQRDTKADLGYHCQGQRFSRLHYKSSTWGFPSMTSFSIDFYDLGVETLNCNPSPQEAETKGLNLDCTVRFSQEYKIKGQWDDSAGKSTCTLPEDLHLIHGTYKVEGENQVLQDAPLTFMPWHDMANVYPHMCTNKTKCKKKFNGISL